MSTVHSGASARPGPALGQGLGRQAGGQQKGWASVLFVLKVPRHRHHWPFLAWALGASGNDSRTIISGGMCYFPTFPESQAVSCEIGNVPFQISQFQAISKPSGGHSSCQNWKNWELGVGSKRLKAPFPSVEKGWFRLHILGSQGPAWSQASRLGSS